MGQEYEVLVVDTAGQDEFSIFPTQYTMDIDGYILVYSIDNDKSFEVVQVIYEKLVDLLGNPAVPLVLVGNKCDLHMDRRISEATGKKLAGLVPASPHGSPAVGNTCPPNVGMACCVGSRRGRRSCCRSPTRPCCCRWRGTGSSVLHKSPLAHLRWLSAGPQSRRLPGCSGRPICRHTPTE